jgi:hypothetical protein
MTDGKDKTKTQGDDDKGEEQRGLSERLGRKESGPALHPTTKESGTKGASNVGQDETSGSE